MKKTYFKKSVSLILTVLMLMSCWVFFPGEHNHASAADAIKDKYLFAYFTGNSSDGQTIHLAVSEDGLHYTALRNNEPVIIPSKGTGAIRDPYLWYNEQDNYYYLIGTDMDSVDNQWWDNCNGFLMWRSKDLIHWYDETFINIYDMLQKFNQKVGIVHRAWAPQLMWDGTSYVVYFSIDTDNVNYPADQLSIVYLKTTDLMNLDAYYEYGGILYPGFDVNDADIIQHPTNGKWYLFYKPEATNEYPTTKINMMVSDNATGPYTSADPNNSRGLDIFASVGEALEGPNGYFDNEGNFVMYADAYGHGSAFFYIAKTPANGDFKNWTVYGESAHNINSLSPRHGSVVKITTEEYNRLLNNAYGITSSSLSADEKLSEHLVGRYFTTSDSTYNAANGKKDLIASNVIMYNDYLPEKIGYYANFTGSSYAMLSLNDLVPDGFDYSEGFTITFTAFTRGNTDSKFYSISNGSNSTNFAVNGSVTNNTKTHTTGVNFADNALHDFVISYADGNIIVYKDGELLLKKNRFNDGVMTEAWYNAISDGTLYIGALNGSSGHIVGGIADFCIYDCSMSYYDVKTIQNEQDIEAGLATPQPMNTNSFGTAIPSFTHSSTSQMKDLASKNFQNVIYSPQITGMPSGTDQQITGSSYTGSTAFYATITNTQVAVYYPKNTVLYYDGVNTPKMPVMFAGKTSTDNYKAYIQGVYPVVSQSDKSDNKLMTLTAKWNGWNNESTYHFTINPSNVHDGDIGHNSSTSVAGPIHDGEKNGKVSYYCNTLQVNTNNLSFNSEGYQKIQLCWQINGYYQEWGGGFIGIGASWQNPITNNLATPAYSSNNIYVVNLKPLYDLKQTIPNEFDSVIKNSVACPATVESYKSVVEQIMQFDPQSYNYAGGTEAAVKECSSQAQKLVNDYNAAKAKLGGHKVLTVPSREPSCAAPGLTTGSYCEYCGKIYAEQTTTEKLPHTFGAKFQENGEYYVQCSVCGIKLLVKQNEVRYENMFSLNGFFNSHSFNGGTVENATAAIDFEKSLLSVVNTASSEGYTYASHTNKNYANYSMAVEPNTTYVAEYYSTTAESLEVFVFYHDKDQNYINHTAKGTSAIGVHAFEFTTPANCEYIEFRFDSNTAGKKVAVADFGLYTKASYNTFAKENPYSRLGFNTGESIELYTPKRIGYEFLGWYTSNGTKVTNTNQLETSVTVYAKWREVGNSVLYNGNLFSLTEFAKTNDYRMQSSVIDGHVWVDFANETFNTLSPREGLGKADLAVNSQLDTYNTPGSYKVPVTAGKEYVYTATHADKSAYQTYLWFYNSSGGAVTHPATGAQWISHSTNNAANGCVAQWYGNTLVIRFTVPAGATHMSFRMGTTGKYAFTQTFSNIGLYAAEDYDNFVGGYVMPTQTYVPDGEKVTLAEAERLGYVLDGWYENKDLSGSEFTDTSAMTADKTVYAKWKPADYTLKYDVNGGSMSETATVTYKITDTLILPTPTREGYLFMGWKVTTADGNWAENGICGGGESVTGIAGNVTLTAQWQIRKYTISFDNLIDINSWTPGAGNGTAEKTENGGIKITSNSGVGEATLSSPYFAVEPGKSYKIDIDFIGDNWDVYIFFCDENGAWIDFVDGPSNRFSSYNDWSNVFTAPNKPAVVKAQIRLDANGGNNTVTFDDIRVYEDGVTVADGVSYSAPITKEYGSAYGTLPVPTKEGYTFLGWFLKDGTQITADTVVSAENVFAYSKWQADSFTVTFVNAAGDTVETKQYNYGTTPTAPANTAAFNDAAGHHTFAWPTISTVTGDVTYKETETIGNHTVVTDAAVTATCTTPGKTEGSHCSVCNYVIVAQTEIPVAGHTWSDATCTAPKTCSVCGATDGNALGHLDTNKDHVCERNCGVAQGTCSDSATDDDHVCDYGCGKVLEECSDAANDGNHKCDVCGEADITAHIKGEEQKENITEATCGKVGKYDSVYYCTECNAVMERTDNIVIPATGQHTEGEAVVENKKAPTCTVDGSHDEVVYCSVCGDKLSTETVVDKATGHNYTEFVEKVAPTCTVDGYTTYKCSRCDETENRDTVTAPGHTPAAAVKENINKATCEADGSYEEVVYCSVCTTDGKQTELSREEKTITKLTHDMGEWYYAKEEDKPTYTKAGTQTRDCKNINPDTELYEACSHSETQEVPMLEDETAPTGKITYKTTAWDKFLETITFGIYVSDDVKLTIEAADAESGVAKIEYIISDTAMTEEQVMALAEWQTYTNDVTITKVDAAKKVVYAKLTNTQGGVTYLSTDGFTFDTTAPVINASAECTSATITVTEVNLEKVTVNGEVITLDENGTYTIITVGTFEVIATDKAGNTAEASVEIKGHTEGEAVIENRVEATCYAEGSYDEVVYCSVCEEAGKKTEISRTPNTIAKIAHTEGEAVIENKVEATCYAEGSYEEVVYCSVEECHHEISRTPNTIAKIAHTEGEAVIENRVEASCYAEGSYDEVVYCSVCKAAGITEELSRVKKTIAKAEHTPATAVVENKVEATCYAEGSYDEVVYCSVEACKYEISRTPKTIEKIAHIPAEAVRENETAATCYAEGSYDSVVYCSVEACRYEISRTPKTIEKIAHTPATAVVENKVEATCYAEGSYDEVIYCSVCAAADKKTELSRTPKTIEKIAHTEGEAVIENRVEASCYAEGSYDEVVYCSVEACKHEISRTPKTIEKIAHTPATAVVENKFEASCYAEGSYEEVIYCSVAACKYEISREEKTIEKIAHTPAAAVQENVKDSTCYAEGSYDEVVYCSVAKCHEKLSSIPKTIAKKDHTPAEAVREKEVAATCYAEGSYEEVIYCSVEACKHEISRTPKTIEKIAHTPATAVVENKVEATCYAEGSYDEVIYCSVCAAADKKTEISRVKKTIAKAEHTPATAVVENKVEATCYAEGSYDEVVYCSVCAAADKKTEISRTPKTIEKTAHTPAEAVKEKIVVATCYAEGSYEEVIYCSAEACKAEISREEKTIEKIDHTPAEAVREKVVAATCYVEGSYDEVVYCSVAACKHEISREEKTIEKIAHTPAAAVQENVKDSSCYAEGSYDEVVYCSVCAAAGKTEEISRTEKTIAKIAHTPADAVVENNVKPDCENDGSYDSVVYCSVAACHFEISRDKVTVAKTGHNYTSEVTTAPDCIEKGVRTYTCQNDATHTYTEEIAPLGHIDADNNGRCDRCSTLICDHKDQGTVTTDKVDAKCETDGYTGDVRCAKCNEIVQIGSKVDRTGHEYEVTDRRAATCTEDGYETYTCKNDTKHAYTEILTKLGHTPAEAVIENKVAATCYAEGSYDEVVYCSVEECHHEISRTPNTIAKIAHTEGEAVIENRVEASCYAEGSYEAVVYCSVEACKHEISRTPKTIEKIDHTAAAAVQENVKDSTCYAEGSYDEVVYCSVCAAAGKTEEISRTEKTIAKIAHTPADAVVENNVNPDCENDGSYDSVVYCSVEACHFEISRDKVTVDALGHTAGAEATCTEPQKCTVCGEVLVEALGHDYESVITPPTCEADGYTTKTCSKCGDSYTVDITSATGHAYDKTKSEDNLARPTKNEDGTWNDGYYTFVCGNNDAHTTTEPVKRADYSEYETAVRNLNELLNTDITEEAKNAINAAIANNVIADNLIETEQANVKAAADALNAVFELYKGALNTYKVTFIVDGETVKTDTVISGSSATAPAEVTKAPDADNHYTFTDWDKVFTNVIADITVTAQFESEAHTFDTHTDKDDTYHTDKCDCGYETDVKHSYDDGEVTTEPKCETKGEKTFTCSVCSGTRVEDVDASGHAYAVTDHKDATCTENGYDLYTCGNDNTHEYTAIIEAPGHTLTQVEAKAPTCTEAGYEAYEYCSVCDYTTFKEVAATGHSYDKVVTAPTCEDKGYTTYTCACGDTYVDDYVDATGHSYTESITKTPTCTVAGEKTFTCSCGDSYTEEIPANGHTLTQVEAKTPTCTEAGYEAYEYCSVCDYTTFKEVAATGHSYDKVVTAPTCTAQGYTTYTCACGESYVDDYTDKLDHEYTSEITTPATHLTEGVETFTCKCGDTYTEPVAKLEGHTYTSKVTKEATHLEEGVKTFTCECGDTYTEAIAKLTGHTYEAVVTAPTCTAQGYTTYTCACGESYVDDYTDKLDHEYTSEITTPATHLTEGVETFTCKCGDTYTKPVAKLEGHTYTSEVTKEATHLEEGEKTFTCECGDTYTEAIAKLTGHTYEAVVTAPTCEDKGYTTYTCACGDTYIADEVAALGHTWTAATCTTPKTCSVCGKTQGTVGGHTVVTLPSKAPTCEEEGFSEGSYCSVCKEIFGAQIEFPATGHIEAERKENIVPSTCEEEGSYDLVTYCVTCGKVLDTEAKVIDKLDHTPAAENIVEEVLPTCKEDGYRIGVIKCSVCGEEIGRRTIVLPALKHSPVESKYVAPTCEETGLTEGLYCEVCGTVIVAQEVIPAKGHKKETITATVEAATCTKEGVREITVFCTVCDKTLSVERKTIPVADHTPGEEIRVNVTGATCGKNGKYTSIINCSVCGEEISNRTVIIPSTGEHEFTIKKNRVEPTCSENGYITYACEGCGTQEKTILYATGHTDKNGDSVCDDCGHSFNNHCGCMCHKDNWFMRFIYKIVRFFWKLFKIHKECYCGSIHY